jgi:hypothetical protein
LTRELTGALEAREDEVLLLFLVIVLDERSDQLASPLQDLRVHLAVRVQRAQRARTATGCNRRRRDHDRPIAIFQSGCSGGMWTAAA